MALLKDPSNYGVLLYILANNTYNNTVTKNIFSLKRNDCLDILYKNIGLLTEGLTLKG